MAERIQDNEDRALAALFASEALPDDGFSERVVMRIRRRARLERLLLPLAVLGGGIIAAGPAGVLLYSLAANLAALPELLARGGFEASVLSTVSLSGMLLASAVFLVRMLED